MHSETSSHSGQRNPNDGKQFGKLRCTEVHMVMLGFNGWGLQASLASSDSELHCLMLSLHKLSFQESVSSNFTLDGNQFT